jgi:hypothetical protein
VVAFLFSFVSPDDDFIQPEFFKEAHVQTDLARATPDRLPVVSARPGLPFSQIATLCSAPYPLLASVPTRITTTSDRSCRGRVVPSYGLRSPPTSHS